jgi:hypothetical protein
MSLTLLDREGRALDRQQWLRRSGDRGYCVTRLTKVGGFVVTVSWVGVSTPLSPHTWCLRVGHARPDGQGNAVLARDDQWFGSQVEAEAVAKILEEKIRWGKFRPEEG